MQDHVDHEDRRRQRARDIDQQHRKAPQATLELGFELMPAQPGGDLAELGASTSCHHHRPAAASVDDGTHQRAPGQFGERGAGRDGGRVLVHRQRLAGEHRLVAGEPGDLQQPDVGRDDVAQMQVDDVAGHEVGDVDRGRAAVADHGGLVPDLVMKGLGGLLGAVFVDEPEPDRERDDDPNDQRVASLADEVGRGRRREQQREQR